MRPVRVSTVNRAVKQRRAHLTRDIIEVVVVIGLVFAITRFTIQGRSVTDGAMRPSLEPNQLVLVNSVAYLFGEPQRGDVIVFVNPSPSDVTGRPLIRRIVAVPGDTIALSATQVQVNGTTLKEPYITVPFGQAQNATIEPGRKLGSNEFYVLCDSRVADGCSDSRTFGPVPRANIQGKAVMVYWPINSMHLLPNYSEVFSQVGKH